MSLFQAGDLVMLIDNKGRRYLIELDDRGEFHTHRGRIPHAAIIGEDEGVMVGSTMGGWVTALRPRLADFILKMPRGAQVVYPKDIGPIVVWADIGPGMTVLEAGTGSGGLTLGLLRAVGERGRVITIERRPDHHQIAHKTVTRWLGGIPDNLEMRVGELEAVMEEVCPERIVLDLPEPWHAARLAADLQAGGGIFCSYLPTVPQIQTLVEALEPAYGEIEVFETMHRTWKVEGRSVRPDHRMIGHTGFVVVARKLSPGSNRGDMAGRSESGPVEPVPSA